MIEPITEIEIRVEGEKERQEGRERRRRERGILKELQDVNTLSFIVKDVQMWSKIYFSTNTLRTLHTCDAIVAQLSSYRKR